MCVCVCVCVCVCIYIYIYRSEEIYIGFTFPDHQDKTSFIFALLRIEHLFRLT